MSLESIVACVAMLLGVPPIDADRIELEVVTPLELQTEVGPGPIAYAWTNNRIWITDPDNYGVIAHEIAHLHLWRSGFSGTSWHHDLAYWVEVQFYPQCYLLDEPESR